MNGEASPEEVRALFAELMGALLASDSETDPLLGDTPASKTFGQVCTDLRLASEDQQLFVKLLATGLGTTLTTVAEVLDTTSLEYWQRIAAGLFGSNLEE